MTSTRSASRAKPTAQALDIDVPDDVRAMQRYVLSSDPKAFKKYLGAFERLPFELRMAALGLAA